jgi:hypothetical protein
LKSSGENVLKDFLGKSVTVIVLEINTCATIALKMGIIHEAVMRNVKFVRKSGIIICCPNKENV